MIFIAFAFEFEAQKIFRHQFTTELFLSLIEIKSNIIQNQCSINMKNILLIYFQYTNFIDAVIQKT